MKPSIDIPTLWDRGFNDTFISKKLSVRVPLTYYLLQPSLGYTVSLIDLDWAILGLAKQACRSCKNMHLFKPGGGDTITVARNLESITCSV